MPRGGARPGAGRRKGKHSKLTEERIKQVARVASAGVTPLEVLITAMRDAWDRKDVDNAVAYAVAAAPYTHPRLAATSVSVNDNRNLDELSTSELIAALEAGRDSSGASEAETGFGEPDQVH